MKKYRIFKLLNQGVVHILIDSIIAFRAFGDCSRIYISSGETFDVEETVERIGEIVRS
jgi:hypothetical protein